MLAIALSVLTSLPAVTAPKNQFFPLTTTKGLIPYDVKLTEENYKGRKAVRMITYTDTLYGSMAVLPGVNFKNGTIEFDVAGMPIKGDPHQSRGFVGIAFRMANDMHHYESFYLRMTNGRSPQQELRNHAVQYCSIPDFPWFKLRKDKPFRYEAYTDLVPGEWTHVKLSVHGTEAKFWINHAKQPTLVVHDLLGGEKQGMVALWITSQSIGYFSNLRIRAA